MPSDKHIKIKHFSTKEEQTLWQLAQERKDILESKVSDAATWKRKELTWELLAQKFYDETGVCREWKKLRDKFLDMKRRKRKEALSMTKGYTPTDTLTKKELDIDASNGQPDVCEEDSLADVLSDHDTANIIGVQDDDMSSSSSKWTASNRSILRKETHVLPENANDDNCSLEKEKINLIRLQQDFYRSENLRAQERHNCEMRDKATQNCDESRERKLRIKLLELEVLEKRAKLKLKS